MQCLSPFRNMYSALSCCLTRDVQSLSRVHSKLNVRAHFRPSKATSSTTHLGSHHPTDMLTSTGSCLICRVSDSMPHMNNLKNQGFREENSDMKLIRRFFPPRRVLRMFIYARSIKGNTELQVSRRNTPMIQRFRVASNKRSFREYGRSTPFPVSTDTRSTRDVTIVPAIVCSQKSMERRTGNLDELDSFKAVDSPRLELIVKDGYGSARLHLGVLHLPPDVCTAVF